MHRHRVSRSLGFTPEQLFELVGDVALYPEFVPWVTHMSVRNPRSEGAGVYVVDAEAAVGFSFLKERFSTKVRRDTNRLQIETRLISGPFKHLRNDWQFRPNPIGCTVIFEIEFAFKSRLLDAFLAANFNRAVDKLICCFEARAKALYGAPPPVVPLEAPAASI